MNPSTEDFIKAVERVNLATSSSCQKQQKYHMAAQSAAEVLEQPVVVEAREFLKDC